MLESNNRVLLIFTLLVASGLRLYGLSSQSLWSDEIFEAVHAQRILSSISSIQIPQIRFLITHFSMNLGQGEFFVRLPYAVAGILGVAMIFVVGKMLFGEETGLISGFLLTISSFHIAYSQEARSYAYTVLLSLICIIFIYRALDDNKLIHWLGFSIFTAISFSNHLTSVSVFISLFLFAALVLLSDLITHRTSNSIGSFLSAGYWSNFFSKAKFSRTIQLALSSKEVRLILSAILAVILFIPFGIGWFSYFQSTNTGINNPIASSARLTWPFLLDLLRQYGAGGGLALILYLVGFAAGLFFIINDRQWKQMLLISLLLIVPLILFPFIRTDAPFHFRHLIFMLPIYLIVIAKGIYAISKYIDSYITHSTRLHKASWNIGLIALIGLFGLFSTATINSHYKTQKEDWRGVSQFIRSNAKSEDLVFQLSLWPRNGIPYYLNDYLEQSGVSYIDVFDSTTIIAEDLPRDIWWVVRTEVHEGPLQTEKLSQLQELLGPGFDVYNFPRVSLIRSQERIFTIDEILDLASILLFQEQTFDIADVQDSYAWAWLRLGDAEFLAGNLQRASEQYSQAIASDPSVVDSYMLLANVYINQGRLMDALASYEQAIEVNTPYGPSHIQSWHLSEELGISEEVKESRQQAINNWGQEWFELSASQLSDLLVDHSHFDDAIRVLQKELEVFPSSGKLHLYLGEAYIKKMQSDSEQKNTYLDLAARELELAKRLLSDVDEIYEAEEKIKKLKLLNN